MSFAWPAVVTSELDGHTETFERDPEADDAWVFSEPHESLESFLTAYPPSTTEKSWITTQHDGRKQVLDKYYTDTMGSGCVQGREAMDSIREAWEATETKSLETLSAIMKEHRMGCGKWMVFAQSADVDAVWAKIVSALWEGKLGHTAKVSGVGPSSQGSHVICVYVDPFWEVVEVERVLSAIRMECGVVEGIKYKVDGITLLNLPKDNEHGIPPSFYAAQRESLSVNVQTAHAGKQSGVPAWRGKHGGKQAYAKPESVGSWRDAAPGVSSRPSTAPTAPPAEADKKKKKKADTGSAFAALAGIDDGDAEAILEKKRKKEAKKAAKKAAEAAAIAEASAADFEALKASVAAGTNNWADDDDDDEEEAAAGAEAARDDDDEEEEGDGDERPSNVSAVESEAAEEAAAAPEAGGAGAAAETAKERRAKKGKAAKEEEDVDALLAALEAPKEKAAEPAAEGLSKAAQKRAKQAAKAAAEAEAAAKAEAENAAPAEAKAEAGGEGAAQDNAAPKSAEEIKQMMAKKAAAAKAKKGGKTSDAAAVALKEAQKREVDKKAAKKQNFAQGPGKQVGQKARGSDNKYQGE